MFLSEYFDRFVLAFFCSYIIMFVPCGNYPESEPLVKMELTEQIMKKLDVTETLEMTAQMLAPAMMVETMVMTEQMMPTVPLVKMDLTEMVPTAPLAKFVLTEVFAMLGLSTTFFFMDVTGKFSSLLKYGVGIVLTFIVAYTSAGFAMPGFCATFFIIGVLVKLAQNMLLGVR